MATIRALVEGSEFSERGFKVRASLAALVLDKRDKSLGS